MERVNSKTMNAIFPEKLEISFFPDRCTSAEKIARQLFQQKHLHKKNSSSTTNVVYRPLIKRKIQEYLESDEISAMWNIDEEEAFLRSDLGLDSLDWSSLYVYLESTFNVNLPDYYAEQDITIKKLIDDLVEAITKK